MKKKTKKRSPKSSLEPARVPTDREAIAAALLALEPGLVVALQTIEDEIHGFELELVVPVFRKNREAYIADRRARINALTIARDKIARRYASDSASMVLGVWWENLKARRAL
jgi:hypothetical protein